MINGLWRWEFFFTDWLFAKWFIGLIIGLTVWLYPTLKRSKLLFLYLSWCAYSAISTYFLDYGSDPIIKFKTRPEILYWLCAFLIGTGFMFHVKKCGTKIFHSLYYINCAWIIIGTGILGNERWAGIYGNISLSTTLLAILYSFTLQHPTRKKICFDSALALICLIICHSFMGAFAFVGALSITYFVTIKNKKKWFAIPLIFLALGMLFSKEIYDRTKHMETNNPYLRLENAVSTSSRISTWKLAWKAVHGKGAGWARPISGYGYGSWSSLGMLLQAPKGFKRGVVYNIQMHNDVLQTIFEIGWGGFLLWVALLADIFRRSLARKEWWLVYFSTAYFLSSFGNFPRYLAIEHFVFFFMLNYTYLRYNRTKFLNKNLI